MKVVRVSKADPTIPTASMADIAFLLIIFFLVTTTMKMDLGMKIILPAEASQTQVQKKNVCHIWINAQDQVALEKEIVAIDDIEGIIEGRLRENPKLIVSLKTHREATYNTMVQVIDELKKANATRLSLVSPD
jgi:biopolymer transport protein ExbD